MFYVKRILHEGFRESEGREYRKEETPLEGNPVQGGRDVRGLRFNRVKMLGCRKSCF
jgi:hypothetical protein